MNTVPLISINEGSLIINEGSIINKESRSIGSGGIIDVQISEEGNEITLYNSSFLNCINYDNENEYSDVSFIQLETTPKDLRVKNITFFGCGMMRRDNVNPVNLFIQS